MWDNGGRNIKLNEAKYMAVGSQGRDSALTVVAQGVGKDRNSLAG